MSDSEFILNSGEWFELLHDLGGNIERVTIDKNRVPESLWQIIPAAELWGIADDVVRDRVVAETPPDVAKRIVSAVRAVDDRLDDWFASVSCNEGITPEYVAFSATRMAVDFYSA